MCFHYTCWEMIMKILRYGMLVLQSICLLAVIILESLTKMKPLVMRHIYVRKFEHLNQLTFGNRIGMVVTIFIVVLISLVLVRKKGLKRHTSLIVVTSLVCVSLLLPFQFLLSYSYLIGALLLIMLIEYIKFGLKERST